jgi:hypothetical protein
MRPRVLVLVLLPSVAAAQDAFERQVYDSDTAPKGTAGAELHVNHSFGGSPEPVPLGEVPRSSLTRFTLEPHVGCEWWCEGAFYLQTALRPDGNFDFAGVKARFKARTRKRLDGRMGLALNTELSMIPTAYEPQRFGAELRPIIDFRDRRLYASFNPIMAFELTGPTAVRPSFEPAAKLAVRVNSAFAMGPEYYGAWGTIAPATPHGPWVHLLYGVVDLFSPWFDLNLGLGYGFHALERWNVKAIFAFHRP